MCFFIFFYLNLKYWRSRFADRQFLPIDIEQHLRQDYSMDQSYNRENIKALVVKNQGIIYPRLFELSGLNRNEFEEIFTDLEMFGVLSVKVGAEETKVYFNFGRPYFIGHERDFYGETQRKLAAKGYRWQETIFNDRSRADVILKITRDTDPFWSSCFSCSSLTTGWGRFDRWTAWNYASEWLDKGGFGA